MRFLFLGDVVGRSGREAVSEYLPGLRERYKLDFVAINGENAAGGFGITEKIFRKLLDDGADCVTTGNHTWDQREALVFAEREERFLRPINYPQGTPGRGANVLTARNGARVLVMNAMGQAFISNLDDPLQAVEQALADCPLGSGCDVAVLDMHAEATSEKQTMGVYFDGRMSVVVGTHTHAPTADHRIFPGGTAYISDIGICGCYDSVLGFDKEEPIIRATTKISAGRLEPATGPGAVTGLAVDIDDSTGLARFVSPLRIGPHISNVEPDFWD